MRTGRLAFEITARDGEARSGVLRTPHGEVPTPAFVPLATGGVVRSLTCEDVEGLGYRMVLGNTYHLWITPGDERIAALGGLHDFMSWPRAIITDSGGFQVFSLAHGSVADEVKGRDRRPSRGSVTEISERGVVFRSYLDGSEQELTPEKSMAIQAALGSDIALVLDECTPFHADRDYTARSTERTHRWLDRCLDWHAQEGPAEQAVFGIVQGGTWPDLRRESAERVSDAPADGIAIGGTLGETKDDMLAVLDQTIPFLPDAAPRHLLGIGEVDDLLEASMRGIDTFDCAVPTRLGRHGMALAPLPDRRFRYDISRSEHALEEGPLVDGCRCPTCARYSRGYVHHLVRRKEMTGARLVTLHNLAFHAALMEGIRGAIAAGSLAAYRDAVIGGVAPWDAAASAAG